MLFNNENFIAQVFCETENEQKIQKFLHEHFLHAIKE